MQIGYNDAELHEPIEERLELLPNYPAAFSGHAPGAAEIREFTCYERNIHQGREDE